MKTLAEHLYERRRLEGVIEAIRILESLRKEVVHEPSGAWDKLYNSGYYLLRQLTLKEEGGMIDSEAAA